MLSAAVVAVVASGLAPGPAQASRTPAFDAGGGVPVTGQLVRASLEAAGEHWRGVPSPCVRIVVRAYRPALAGPDRGDAGWARAGECRVGLNAARLRSLRRDRAGFCAVVVHEVGHVLGRGHDRAWGSVMNPRPSVLGAPACLDGVARDRR